MSTTGPISSALMQAFPTGRHKLEHAKQQIREIPFIRFDETSSHGAQHDLAAGDFTNFFQRLTSDFTIPRDIQKLILDALCAELNREVIREMYFSRGNPGWVTYGQIVTRRCNDGSIDVAHTVHRISFQLQPMIITTKYKKTKRILGMKCGHKNKYRSTAVPRSLSDQEGKDLQTYAMCKAFLDFTETVGQQ